MYARLPQGTLPRRGHGPFARFSWSLGPAGGAPVAGGTDIARLDEQGRVVEVIGFLDGRAGQA